MLIVSKFHDYYDRVVSFGIDKTVVYQRTESKIEFKRTWQESKIVGTPHEEKFYFSKGVEAEAYKYVIGFCGKLYPVIKFILHYEDRLESHCFYDEASVRKFLSHKKISKEKQRWWYSEDFSVLTDYGLSNFFNNKKWSFLSKHFVEHNVPVFVYGRLGDHKHHDYLVLNPRLKDFDFYRAVDTVTAFQQIYMYISGVLGVPTNPMVKLNDKELAAKKGHGDPYSFRRLPGEKKRKKKNG